MAHIRMQVQHAALFLLSVVATVHCYSSGAPAAACTDIYPVGHPGTSQDLSTNPFQLSLSDFDETHGGEFYYIAGKQYSCKQPNYTAKCLSAMHETCARTPS